MMQLNFTDYMEELAREKTLRQRLPTTHYFEDDTLFVLYFKNYEDWEYYTVVSKSDVVEFGQMYNADPVKAIQDFKGQYMHKSLQLLSRPELSPKQAKVDDVDVTDEEIMYRSVDPNPVEESEDYGAFFEKQVERWKQHTLKALDKAELDHPTKSFGEFLQFMTNAINTLAFMGNVKRYVKDGMTAGLEQAEDELNVQVGANEAFNDRVDALVNQQLNGYTINGKQWYGIRGAAADTRLQVLQVIEEGVREKRSKDEIARAVQDVFEGSTLSQAKRIVRTETTRFINEGKITTYKSSEIEGKKAWSAVPNSCCDECQQMANAYADGIPFDDDFVTPDDRHVQHGPLHPNCRCVVEYRAP